MSFLSFGVALRLTFVFASVLSNGCWLGGFAIRGRVESVVTVSRVLVWFNPCQTAFLSCSVVVKPLVCWLIVGLFNNNKHYSPIDPGPSPDSDPDPDPVVLFLVALFNCERATKQLSYCLALGAFSLKTA